MRLLEVDRLSAQYPTPKGLLRALEAVSFTVDRGETLGVVGESGSGKSTLARALLRLGAGRQTSGRVLFDGQDVLALGDDALRSLRRRMQPVFQDPSASLDPRLPIGAALAEAFFAAGVKDPRTQNEKLGPLLEALGLPDGVRDRLPRELSSGQRQRVCIGRALAVGSEFLVLDEPVSALDVSVQAQVLELLVRLRAERGLTYLFISHDLGVVAQVCSRVAVMNSGRIVELGPVAEVLDRPKHPYTAALLASVPARTPAQKSARLVPKGEPPSPFAPPAGCAFHPRCPKAQPRCQQEVPLLSPEGPHQAACFFPG